VTRFGDSGSGTAGKDGDNALDAPFVAEDGDNDDDAASPAGAAVEEEEDSGDSGAEREDALVEWLLWADFVGGGRRFAPPGRGLVFPPECSDESRAEPSFFVAVGDANAACRALLRLLLPEW